MIKIAICDDSKEDIDNIHAHLKRIDVDVLIETFYKPSLLLNSFIDNKYDVVMLDIDMPDMTGFELATKLKEICPNIIIIFITHKSQLIYDSFKYRPISFINKNSLFELENIFDDVQHELRLMHPHYTFIKDNIQTIIPYQDILYFKKVLNNVEIHTLNCIIQNRTSLKTIESEISTNSFIHLSKSIYLNTIHILHIDYTNLMITLKNGENIKFSRLYKKHIQDFLC